MTALVSGDPGELLEHVRERASAFAGGDQAVRRRALARAAAVQEAVMGEIGVLMTQAIARRDLEAARALDQLLTNAASRYRMLLDQLRVDGSRRVTMLTKGPVAMCAEEPA